MNTWKVLLLGCLLAASSHAQTRREIWEWTDADGIKHYSDAPAPGARKIVLIGAQAAPQAPAPAEATRAAVVRGAPGSNTVSYTVLEIWSPDPEQSFFGTDAVVEVRLRSEPDIADGDRLRTYLDGKQIGAENQLVHVVSGLPRGAHTVTGVIFNAQGGEKIRSAPVVFHIKQTTVDNPASRGPALRPPPAPGPVPAPANNNPKSG